LLAPPFPADEDARLASLRHRAILDTDPEPAFDELVDLASLVCDTPIAAITLVDRHRQWFKASKGLAVRETPRALSFCGHTILKSRILVVPDSRVDARFSDNPLVTGDPFIRSYAGTPLVTPGGHRIGALCVIDTKPRGLTRTQHRAFRMLGSMVMRLIEARCAHSQRGESDRRFLVTADTVPVLVWMAGPDQAATFFNARWLRFTGRDAVAEQGSGWTESIHPDDLPNWVTTSVAGAGSRREFRVEFRLRRADGEYRWIDMTVTPHFDAAGSFLGYIAAGTDVSEQRQLESALLEITSREQGRLAAELHDGLGQELTGLTLLIAALTADRQQGHPPAANDLEQLHRIAMNALQTTRTISKGVSPLSHFHGGLPQALREYAKLQRGVYGVPLQLIVDAVASVDLPGEVQDHLYRIAQEGVINAAKHARAEHITLALTVQPSFVRIEIHDDGIGIAPDGAAVDGAGGMGLRIMQFRARLSGAHLLIEPASPRGTRIRCECPQNRHGRRGRDNPVAGPRGRGRRPASD
jgi:PAS domain S-box-containing protein